jgi:hypothetical protein
MHSTTLNMFKSPNNSSTNHYYKIYFEKGCKRQMQTPKRSKNDSISGILRRIALNKVIFSFFVLFFDKHKIIFSNFDLYLSPIFFIDFCL